MRTLANAPGQPLSLARAAVSRAAYLTRHEAETLGGTLGRVWGFRAIGVVAEPSAPEGRVWLFARPGIERPLSDPRTGKPHAPMVLVFDVNGVLGAKLAAPARGHLRLGRGGEVAFVLRPGAAKLLRVCAAAGHSVWLWSTMQRGTVDAIASVLAPWIPPGRRLCAEDCSWPADGSGSPAKDLARVWQHEPPGSDRRTLLLDDDPTKGRLQPHCVRAVPRFAPSGGYDLACVSDRGAAAMLEAIVLAAHAEPRHRAEDTFASLGVSQMEP